MDGLFIVTWINKSGKQCKSTYQTDMINALRLVHILGYDRTISNIIIKKK